jgi:predicted peroxiredoxin
MIRRFLVVFSIIGVLFAAAVPLTPAAAGSHDPLFVNLTSDDAHRVRMALAFAEGQAKLGHPVTIWLNDRGVYAGSKAKAGDFAEAQAKLAGLIAGGAVVIACPLCIKHYGVAETDLLDGIKVGNPQMMSDVLFKDDTQSLTW